MLVINDLIRAIGFDQFKIRLNNRKVLNGILEKANLAEHSVAVLRALDKLPKIGPEKVRQEMLETTGAPTSSIDQILMLSQISGTNREILQQTRTALRGQWTCSTRTGAVIGRD